MQYNISFSLLDLRNDGYDHIFINFAIQYFIFYNISFSLLDLRNDRYDHIFINFA
jgi:hypothetical protein